jgi:dipeptidyl aminopeptidase/acylaminoacyl peptidase
MTTTLTRTGFPLEELVRLPSFYYPVVSHDGGKVAFYSDQSGRMELWVLDLEDGKARQVSRGQVPKAIHGNFVWDRGGRSLVFCRDNDGDEQHNLWLLDIQTGDAVQLTDTGKGQEFPVEFSPDDSWLSFISTRDGQLNLYKMRRDGSEATALTSFVNPVFGGGAWSPDGSRLFVTANETDDLKNLDTYVVPAAGGAPTMVFSTVKGAQDRAADWSPDGAKVAVTSDNSGVNRAGILDLASGSVQWVGREGLHESSSHLSENGSLLVMRNENAVLLPVVYDLETGREQVPALPEPGSVPLPDDADLARGGRAVVAKHSTDSTRPALLMYDLETGRAKTLVEPAYGSIDPALFASAEDVEYESFDGLRIRALLYRPRAIAEGERVPAVVMPHGGPTWQYFHGWDPYTQFLVNEGYAVLLPNIRGSTGYGVTFRDMARMDWGGADLRDIVAGRNYLASLSFVDDGRIGVFGGSYGGFMTFIAMTKAPEYWKAGVAWVGLTDLAAAYEESMPHFKYFLREQMGDPEENAQLWADRSAANFAGQVRGKLLIVHGVTDPRCPISQARIFRDRLLAAGKVEGHDFEYVELGAEGHGSTDQEQRLRAFTLVADFFARNL